LVRNVCNGVNCAVLAYGQTSSGKTFTMGIGKEQLHALRQGDEQAVEGLVVPFALRELLRNVEEARGKRTFKLLVSFVEVYMEKFYDLLDGRKVVSAMTGYDREVMLVGAKLRPVERMEDVIRLLQIGSDTRITKGTAQNDQSSRSHAVLTIHVQSSAAEELHSSAAAMAAPPLAAKLHLVDLAGSESVGRAGAVGLTAREGNSINKSLMTLREIIQLQLTSPLQCESQASKAKTLYRNSKLTTLLRDALGGNSSTFFVACVSPADANTVTTVSTLEFATTARRIRTKPAVNIG
ncbi:Kif4A type kinesin, partial [Volvox carteri f. nagariensis]